jgi:hypothetical protein
METQPTCPYCNALVPAETLQYTRIRCCRCGESFANSWTGIQTGPPHVADNRWSEGIQSGPPHVAELRGSAGAQERALPPRSALSRSRALALGIVGVMGLVALGALAFALNTWGLRESRHPKTSVELQAARPHMPADLPALGYLPVDCQIVAGVHAAELRKDPVGAQLLEPPLPGLLGVGLHAVEKRTGFKLDDIDHAVFGVTMDGIIPQLTAVVRIRRSYTLEEVARAVQSKPLRHHNLPLFRIKLEPVGGGYLWCADEFTLVMVLRPDAAKIEDMDKIPAKPRKASDGLSGPLREMLESRLKNGVLWLAGHIQDPEPIQTLAGLTRLSKTDAALLAKIQTFALGIQLQEDLTLLGALECRDHSAAIALEKYLAKLDFPGAKSRKVIGPPPNADGPEARWVNLQVRCDPAGMRKMLEAGTLSLPRSTRQPK